MWGQKDIHEAVDRESNLRDLTGLTIDNEVMWLLYFGRCQFSSVTQAMASAAVNYSATSSSTPITQKPQLNGHKPSTDSVAHTKILLLGLRRHDLLSPTSYHILYLCTRRAGKTSIQQVLFNNLPPNQTFYLETTLRIVKHHIEFVLLLISIPS